MSDNTQGKPCQLKLNYMDYYVNYHIRFGARFSTQFGIFSIILFFNCKRFIIQEM